MMGKNDGRGATPDLGRWQTVGFFLLLLFAILFVYRSALVAPNPGGDAYTLTYGNALVRSPDGIYRVFASDFFAGREDQPFEAGGTGYYRPVTNAVFWMEYRLAGENDLMYNLDQQLLHWINACLVFILASLLLPGSGIAPFLAAGLFALHPVNAFAVVRVDARSDILFCFFYLLSLIAYIAAMGSGGWRKFAGVAAGTFLYLCSAMSKEMGATLPMVLVLLHWYWWRQGKEPMRQLVWTLPYWASFGLLMLLHHVVVQAPPDIYAAYPRWVMYVGALKGLAIHLLRVMAPVGADYAELWPLLRNLLAHPLSDPWTFWSVALVGGMLFLAISTRKTAPMVTLMVGCFFVTVAPLFVATRILSVTNDLSILPVEERWIYLPAIPLLMLGSWVAERLARKAVATGREKVAVAIAMLSLFSGMGHLASVHAAAFRNPLVEVKRFNLFPESDLTPYERMKRDSLFAIYVFLPMGKFQEAETRAKRGLKTLSGSPIPYVALAKAYAAQGKWLEVEALLAPWVTPTHDFINEQWQFNKKVASDILFTSHVVPFYFGSALANTGRGKDAAVLLCLAFRRGYPQNEIAEEVRKTWALNGPAKCLNAADKEGCLKNAPQADFPEWRPPLDRANCDRWPERFER